MAEANVQTPSTSSHLLVVAFDFGTTYSGYAFSFLDDPLKIQTNQNWIAGSEKLVSLKTPTCVLLSPDRKFHSFGYDAENKYAELTFDNKHSDWLLFRRFKMLLYQPGFTGIRETDIQYVLTIPAIWNDSAKQFMREAAIKGGIETSRLRLALEPEAASVWCQTLTADNMMALTECGTTYMVVDLGGGTVDVSVHNINQNGTLSELHKASGGPWGGTVVDNNYIAWLSDMFGERAVDRLKGEDMASFFDLLREFETNKRSVRFDATDPLIFKVSAALKEFSEEEEDLSHFSSRLASQNIVIKRDKMKIDPVVARQWFDEPVNSIIRHIEGILSEPNMKNLSTILLVGGFAESMYVQEKIRKAINYKKFIVPNDTGLVVLKGAVRFAHDSHLISTRIMNYTYGTDSLAPFNVLQHPYDLASYVNGTLLVNHVFLKYVSAGECVKVGHTISIHCIPVNMDRTLVKVFSSPDQNPRFTKEPGCKLLGTLNIKHPEGDTLEDKIFEAKMTFGDTELKVKVLIIKTKKEFNTTINCLV